MNKDVDLISMFDESINISPDIESIKIMNLDYIDSEITNW